MSRKVVGSGIAIVALIVVLLIVERVVDRSPTGIAAVPPAPVAAPDVPVAPDTAEIDDLPLPATPVVSAPLPPLDAPLADVADDLLLRADAGDSAAACRLGIELLRCQRLMMFGRRFNLADDWREQAITQETEGNPDDAERMLASADRFAPIVETCRALPDGLLARGPEFLRAAALAGEPEALLREASGNDLFPGGAFGAVGWLDTPAFDRWRQEAPQLLRRALAAGRPEAVLLYADGYGGGHGAVQGLIVDDAQLAAAWQALARRMFGTEAEDLLQPLLALPDEVDAAAAQAQAERWHNEYFDGATFAAADLLEMEAFGVYDPASANADAMPAASACGGGARP